MCVCVCVSHDNLTFDLQGALSPSFSEDSHKICGQISVRRAERGGREEEEREEGGREGGRRRGGCDMFPSLCREGPLTPQRYMGYVALKIGLVQMHLNQHTSPLPTLPLPLSPSPPLPLSLPSLSPSPLLPSPSPLPLQMSLWCFCLGYVTQVVIGIMSAGTKIIRSPRECRGHPAAW